ncbi:MAG TPA: Imm49 family immunity protein [Steroidobacteraceae bacterium]|nr:Imm49 family immunity protein [Steroidobacteraceae bacterium]
MKLSEYAEPLAYEVAFALLGANDPATPVGELGDVGLELGPKLRALAIIVLLTTGNSDAFFHGLIRSAMLRHRFLARAQQEGMTDHHHFVSGRYEPLLDAIAASADALARSIAALAPSEMRPGHEYEDDYCYAQILKRLINDEPGQQEYLALLDRMGPAMDAERPARLPVCRALALQDQSAFDESFEGLLSQRASEITADIEGGQVDEAPTVALRQVYVEGLALLKLAERRGLRTLAEYRYCPSSARVPMRKPFPGE